MSISKTATTVGVGLAIITGSMLAVSTANAHNNGSDEDKSERVTALAEKLGVDEAQVRDAFDELKEEHKAEREASRAEHLSGLVSDGILTQEQADALTAMKDSAKAEVEALKESGAEREETKALMEEKRSEVQAWAEAEGIDLGSIRPEGGERKGRHHGFHKD